MGLEASVVVPVPTAILLERRSRELWNEQYGAGQNASKHEKDASYLGVVHVVPDLVFEVFPLWVLVQVLARELFLRGGPLLRLFGVALKPLVGVMDANLAPFLAPVDVDVVGTPSLGVAIGHPGGWSGRHGGMEG